METEVFRLMEPSDKHNPLNYPANKIFSINKCYEYALYTKSSGRWPDERYFTTNPMQYVGRYVRSTRWGYNDNSTEDVVFNNNGTNVSIQLDNEGRSCFREVPCRTTAVEQPIIYKKKDSNINIINNISNISPIIDTKPTIKNEDLCYVCNKKYQKTFLFLPCAHRCVCYPCGLTIMRTSRICPKCDEPTTLFLHAYHSKYLKYKQKYLKLKNEMK